MTHTHAHKHTHTHSAVETIVSCCSNGTSYLNLYTKHTYICARVFAFVALSFHNRKTFQSIAWKINFISFGHIVYRPLFDVIKLLYCSHSKIDFRLNTVCIPYNIFIHRQYNTHLYFNIFIIESATVVAALVQYFIYYRKLLFIVLHLLSLCSILLISFGRTFFIYPF